MISDNITKKALAIHEEALKFEAGEIPNTPIANEAREKSTQAILKGNTSDEWKLYMSLYSTSDEELARLIPTDGTTDPVRQEARAYLVSNAMCGMGTGKHLLNKVGNKLD